MSALALNEPLVTRLALAAQSRAPLMLALAAALAGGGFAVTDPLIAMTLRASGGAVLILMVFLRLVSALYWRRQRALSASIGKLVELDAAPCFSTDSEGRILYRNEAAREKFGEETFETLATALGRHFANPVAVLFRLQDRANNRGAAREDVVSRRGHMRLSVHRAGPSAFLWRLEDLGDRSAPIKGAEGITLPMLTASRSGTVLFMNEALRRLVGRRVRSLDRIFTDLPLRSGQIHTVTGPDGPCTTRVVEIAGAGGRTEIYLLPAEAGAPPSMDADRDWKLLDSLPVPLIRIRPGGTIDLANEAARSLLFDPVLPGTRLSDLVEGLGRSVSDWLDEGFAGRGLNRPEVLRASRPEQDVFLQITLGRIAADGQNWLIAVLNDATELKTLEAQFVQSQKMQAIGQLAGGVAHDFNNLLTAISGHCDLLLLRHDPGDPDYGDLTQIHQNANRAASLVGQLLAFSRKQTLQPEILDMRETLGEMTHLLNRLVGERITLSLSHDPGLRTMRGDRRQLEQVLMNLVVNARDAMPGGGEIHIETVNLSLEREMTRNRATVPPGDYVSIKVSDDGCGIAADKLAKIFEPFYTTKRTGEGTGLGLSTAYGIVKQTGGFIFVDSAPGAGSTFTLLFPAHHGAAPAAREPQASHEALPQTEDAEGVILLVEDEAPVRAFASRALRLRGYTVIEAENAEEALERLNDTSLKVDVFVTDVIMPGMDGPSWVREALKDRPGVKVVFVSGYAEDNFRDDQSQIPNSVFLPKPFSLSELTTTVHDQIH